MSSPRRMLKLCGCLFVIACVAAADDRLGKLLESLAAKPFDHSILNSIDGALSDPRTIPALKAAFESRTDKEERQWIAVEILRLGERSALYFDFLAGYVTEAIQDHAPVFPKYGPDGQVIRGEFNAVFLNWCAATGKDPETEAKLQAYTYPLDIRILAEASDPRAASLFRAGLQSQNPWVVTSSIEGLGRLQDMADLGTVEKALLALNPLARKTAASALPWFDSTEANSMMERFIPDPSQRRVWVNLVTSTRSAEAQRALQRRGGGQGK